jgi:hypothetical protein
MPHSAFLNTVKDQAQVWLADQIKRHPEYACFTHTQTIQHTHKTGEALFSAFRKAIVLSGGQLFCYEGHSFYFKSMPCLGSVSLISHEDGVPTLSLYLLGKQEEQVYTYIHALLEAIGKEA